MSADHHPLKPSDLISPDHPAIGGYGYRLLCRADRLAADDETACTSLLLSKHPGPNGGWLPVQPAWSGDIGETIAKVVGPESDDVDRNERIFRRRCYPRAEDLTAGERLSDALDTYRGEVYAEAQAAAIDSVAQFVEDQQDEFQSADKGEWSCLGLAEKIRDHFNQEEAER